MSQSDIKHITDNSELFPAALREINQPVHELYIRGNTDVLHSRQMLAVVGSRKASHYGKNVLAEILPAIIEAQIPIISGLAYGIDSMAHKLCVEAKAPTIAVLGGGPDDESIYPKHHIKLAHEIIEAGGTIVSEYEPKTAPLGHFPVRNRIVAGLAQVVLVVQAAKKSGSLITARLALENGRDVAAVPGAITDPLSKGTNFLIQNGAATITCAQDLLDLFGIEQTSVGPEKQLQLTPEQTKLFDHLSSTEPVHVDELVDATKLPPSVISAELIQLEMLDAVTNTGGMKYVKK